MRNALVTGGNRGIGRAIAETLKAAGYNVVVNYANNDEVAQQFTQETQIPAVKFDVAAFDACEAGIAECERVLGGPVDVLVNNAGIARDSFLHKMSALQWHEVIGADLSSLFNVTRPVIEGMRQRKFGRIVNIASVNGQAGQVGQTNYSAAKAGVHGFTKALALESAAKGITVNTVAPGYVNTDMLKNVPEKVMDAIVSKIPVGRLAEPNEIAQAVLFLVRDDAGFITGSSLSVNGGQHMA
ncbi:MAG: acetoacetyl-CoA reductase [Alphaproteobacteria bacterium]|nr:acetoacetyl-CoA reductase [Alphaproteobacteria bacterium]